MSHKNGFHKDQNLSRWVMGLAVCVTLYHWAVWEHIHLTRQISWPDLLARWDSGWYTDIIRNGYQGPNYAFYPLFPAIIAFIAKLLSPEFPIQIIGAILSAALFLGFSFAISRLSSHTHDGKFSWGLLPQTRLGWFIFAWSPASYIFQSHHTESIFLCLSFAAFLACEKKWFYTASLLAGLCALTKNQGIFVAVSVGFWWASHEDQLRTKITRFAVSGILSGFLFALFPMYSYLKTGDLTAFYSAQDHWRPEMTLSSYAKALWFGNSWQNTNLGSLERYALFWLLACAAITVWKKHKPLGLYVALFTGIMPLSGEFVGTFRYSSVICPAWYAFAHWIEALPPKAQKAVVPIVVIAFLYQNHLLTRCFGIGSWSY